MPDATIAPDTYARRSFVYRQLVGAGARFAEIAGAAIALDYGDPEGEAEVARRLGLADLSPLPRCGFKGRGAAEWLAAHGLVVPDEINQAVRQEDGSNVLRLSPSEVLVLGSLSGGAGPAARLEAAWAAESPASGPRGFPVPRAETHAWFRIAGEWAAELFAKLCAVDLRPAKFAHGQIAQTHVAQLSAIVLRDDQGSGLAYDLLADSASAVYLWSVLGDTVAEFGGRPVGLSALRGPD